MNLVNRKGSLITVLGYILLNVGIGFAQEGSFDKIESQFRELPVEARQYIGPLFWLHGTESKERLNFFVDKMAEMGNGSFTAESRPHNDWLGKGWYRDLKICLNAAKRNHMDMWIFDEKWYPSQGVDWKVPQEFAAKLLDATAVDITGPKLYVEEKHSGLSYISTVAGRLLGSGKIDGNTLVDLTPYVEDGKLTWNIPDGKWKIMKFSHIPAPGSRVRQRKQLLVDGASKNCVDWFLQTVYQPHYDLFKDEFGKTVKGFFYDEPETPGDWGTELNKIFNEWGVDWKKAYVAYKFELEGDDQVAARFQYLDAFAEAWGRTMYGGMSKWCAERGVKSIGHFWEHKKLYYQRWDCAGDITRLMKYSDMGGIDAVKKQFIWGKRITSDTTVYQSPKLGSSVSHVYNKQDHLALVEIFGARGQDLTYPEMKWWADHFLVSGINFFIPHSFNPRAPKDVDNPPFFFMDEYEPRWPLYKIFADYTGRASLLLTGGKHVAPVAFLYFGNTIHVGNAVTFESMGASLQDALFDYDLLPFEVFEKTSLLEGKKIKLYDERYKILVVPPVEVIPYPTLLKIKQFYEQGGIVIAYDFLPSKSATIGKSTKDIQKLCSEIWENNITGLSVCKTNKNGGRSYLLPANPTPEQLQYVITQDAGFHPTLEIIKGKTDNWVHVLHREKEGHDLFFITNQNIDEKPRQFTFRITANGIPECWDAMRNQIQSITYKKNGNKVDVTLSMEPNESIFLVFRKNNRMLSGFDSTKIIKKIELSRDSSFSSQNMPKRKSGMIDISMVSGARWIWYPEENTEFTGAKGSRYFRKRFLLSSMENITNAVLLGISNSDIDIFINEKIVRSKNFNRDKGVIECDVSKLLVRGDNIIAIAATNSGNRQAGMICKLRVNYENDEKFILKTDTSWKTMNSKRYKWDSDSIDDSNWIASADQGKEYSKPFFSFLYTFSNIKTEQFNSVFELPANIDLKTCRAFLFLDNINTESAACINVNGKYAGGFIEKPYQIEITNLLEKGKNTVRIFPFAPKNARLIFIKN